MFLYRIASLSVHVDLFPLCGLQSSSHSARGNSEYCSSHLTYDLWLWLTQARCRRKQVITCLASLSLWVLRVLFGLVVAIVINLCCHIGAFTLEVCSMCMVSDIILVCCFTNMIK